MSIHRIAISILGLVQMALNFGCATAASDYGSVTHNASGTTSFRFYEDSSTINGKFFPSSDGAYAGQLSVNSMTRQLFFNGNRLHPIQKSSGGFGGDSYRYWDVSKNLEVIISGPMFSRGTESFLSINSSSMRDISSNTLLRTRSGTWTELQKLLESVAYPPSSSLPLISLWKFIDGNAMNNSRREFVGILDCENGVCSLNGAMASISLSTTLNGKKIRIHSADESCEIGPSGDWLFSSIREPGILKGGLDSPIGEIYMKLRTQLKE